MDKRRINSQSANPFNMNKPLFKESEEMVNNTRERELKQNPLPLPKI